MKKTWFALAFVFGILFFVSPAQAAEEKIQPVADFTDHQRIDEVERTLTSIDRKISRLEDRIEKLDRDVSDLKRKM